MNKDILIKTKKFGEVWNSNFKEWVPFPAVVNFGGTTLEGGTIMSSLNSSTTYNTS
jgi:hypothetical protein